MGQLAVAAVGLTPLVEQGQDLSGFLVEQPMYGRSAWAPVDQLPQGAAGDPAMRADLAELEFVAGATQRPAGLEGAVEQAE